MHSSNLQRGSSLILIIGVIAALAVMAASLVVLVANVQSNTARDRSRAKAFYVAEAGIDVAQNMLVQNWPTSDAMAQNFDTTAFRSQMFPDTGEFPNPAAGAFIVVTIRDDQTNYRYDDGNGIMVIDSTARVGRSAARVQAQVQRIPFDLPIREGVALYADGAVNLNGNGSTPFDVMLPATGATVYAQGGINKTNNVNFPTSEVGWTQDPEVTANDIFPDALRDQLIRLAEKYGNRIDYRDATKAFWLKAFTQFPHVVAIKSGDLTVGPDAIPISKDPDPVWSPVAAGNDKWIFGRGPEEPLPGIIIVENGNLSFDGGAFFFGVLYSSFGFVDTGTTEIHGMVIAKGIATLSGSRNVVYDPDVVANLNLIIPANVRLVPNTWKELTP